jgi:hypothetical protein
MGAFGGVSPFPSRLKTCTTRLRSKSADGKAAQKWAAFMRGWQDQRMLGMLQVADKVELHVYVVELPLWARLLILSPVLIASLAIVVFLLVRRRNRK